MTLTHRPLGSGHPYRIDPDQRHPVQPVAGEPLEIRVTTDPSASSARLHLVDLAGAELGSHDLVDVDPDELYGDGETGDGHLAAASGARPDIGDRVVRRAVLTTPDVPFLYRFTVDGISFDGDRTAPGQWVAAAADEVLAVTGTDRVVADSVSVLTTADGPRRVRFALPLDAAERVVGFGERFDALDQRGNTLDTTVFEQYKQQGNRTYLPSPFAMVIGGAGWGFHVATTRRVWFDVGDTDNGRLWIETTIDDDRPVVALHIPDGTPAELLDRHLDRIGRPVRPPDWVFRPWMSGNEWNTQERVLAEVERSVELDIPVGAVVIEAWSDESTFVAFNDAEYDVHPDGAPHRLDDFTFPADGRWPDPVAMVDRLHELDVKVLLWQIPLVPTDRGDTGQVAADAETMVANGWCVQEADGSPYRNRGWWFTDALLPDWTNPDAVEWWLAKRRYLLDEVGIDGFKTDGGEHAWGDELRYHDGSRGVDANNLFANRYAAAYHRLLTDRGVDGTTFSRAGFTGAGSVPCHWAGDEDSTWEAFRASILAGLNAGLSGVPFWGWDLAGFSGEIPSVELFARSTAMAAFCPIMQYHAEFNHGRLPNRDRTPWNLAERHDDPAPIEIYRHYAHLRERLLPYLAAEADHAVERGVPMMRPVWFDDPADEQAWSEPLHYLFGRGLFVAPVCEPGTEQMTVRLPAGSWIDPSSGERHEAHAVVEVATPLHRIPVFVRSDHEALARVIRG
ncbi:galactose mutarotase-like protein [Ilumatobacter fluminis]|uniref:Galactose mutarotase-like protein n=1 Tax=Ilumatobacter fluminis TaxID=467091 RepID=A0A4R7HY71_9ACTN|nr:TIM-barrel domain-containing protein [Ilumatobacter fluminis]TDT15449.1 galactose mutarotase-like protein [Ilumatobacter fluminis]